MAIQSVPSVVIPTFGSSQSSGVSASQNDTEKVPAVDIPAQSDAPSAAVQSVGATISREQIDKAMNEVKKVLDPLARNLQFSIDDSTGRTVVKVIDASTHQVIRQIPSEEILEMTKAMDSLTGLFVKQKA